MNKKTMAYIMAIAIICTQFFTAVPALAKVSTATEDFTYGTAVDGTSILATGDTGAGFSSIWQKNATGTGTITTTNATLETVSGTRGMRLTATTAVATDTVFRKLDTNNVIYPTLNAEKTTYIHWKQYMDATGSSMLYNGWQRTDFYVTGGASPTFTVGAFAKDGKYRPSIKWITGTAQEINDTSVAIEPGVMYNSLLKVRGTTTAGNDVLSFKMWKVTEQEPADWNVNYEISSNLTPAWFAFNAFNVTKPLYADFKVEAFVDVATPYVDTERTKLDSAESLIKICTDAIKTNSLTKDMVDSMNTVVGNVNTIGTPTQNMAATSLANRRRMIKVIYDTESFKWYDISTEPQNAVTKDFNLPQNSAIGIAYGSTVKWTSSDSSLLQVSGGRAILSPVLSERTVNLMLTITLSTTTYTKTFAITLPKTNLYYNIALNYALKAVDGDYNNITKAVKAYNSLATPEDKNAIKQKLNLIPVNVFVGGYIYKNGNNVTSKYTNQQLKSQFTVMNNTDNGVSFAPTFAKYKNNKLVGISKSDAVVIASKDISNLTFDVPFILENGEEIKIFGWNNYDNISPLYANGMLTESGIFAGNSIVQDKENPYIFEGVFKDDCENFNLVSARTQNLLSAKKSDPTMFYNDLYTISRQIDREEWLEWKVPSAKKVDFTTYYSRLANDNEFYFKLLASNDGFDWENVPVSRTSTYFVGKWYKYSYSANLPQNANYVRIVFPIMNNDVEVYSPQLGDVSIYYDKGDVIGEPVSIDTINSDFKNKVTKLIGEGVLENIPYSEATVMTPTEFAKSAYRVNSKYLTANELSQITIPNSITKKFAADMISGALDLQLAQDDIKYRPALLDVSNDDNILKVFVKGIMKNDLNGNFNPNSELSFKDIVDVLYNAKYVESMKPITTNSISMSTVFSDNMVLQRDKAIKISGKGLINGEAVEVTLNNQIKTTTVQSDEWSVQFAPMSAVLSCQLKVKGLNKEYLFNNVGIGDLWFCSGQSNMKWRLKDSDNQAAEIAQANYPNLRLFSQTAVFASETKENISDGIWQTCTSGTAGEFSAVAYYFGKKLLSEVTDVPIGLINSSVGGSAIEQWMTSEKSNLEGFDYRSDYPVQVHYNAMVNPFDDFSLKGVIWYQGESNANKNTPFYGQLLKNLTAEMRSMFNDASLPVLVVQLPKYSSASLSSTMWAFMREQQATAVKDTPNTYLAVTIDTGDRDNVHPANKAPVGERLGLLALNRLYGKTTLKSDAPMFASAQVNSTNIVITLNNIYDGIQGTATGWFEIADDSLNFVTASYEVQTDNTIKVWNDTVLTPKYVRYGFKNYIDGECLKNSAGIPLAPFRTDSAAFSY